jgi:hypothetical protein
LTPNRYEIDSELRSIGEGWVAFSVINLPSICHGSVTGTQQTPLQPNNKPPKEEMNELPSPTMPLSLVSLPRGSLHRSVPSTGPQSGQGSISVAWASHLDEVRQAQRLRHDVFALEMGAKLNTAIPGHDVDLFDDFCEHLLVRDQATGQVVGTYRVLTPAQAKRVGSTYSDTEFDLTRLRPARAHGRAGPQLRAPDHRHGGVILACGARWPSSWCATSWTP